MAKEKDELGNFRTLTHCDLKNLTPEEAAELWLEDTYRAMAKRLQAEKQSRIQKFEKLKGGKGYDK